MDFEQKRTGVEKKFYDLTVKIVEDNGYELYDVEYIKGSSTLRVFIMDSETKTALIEDCVKVDKSYDEYCETEGWIPDDFTLEVSSPGVYRSLKTLDHFQSVVGEVISVTIQGKLETEALAAAGIKDKHAKHFRGTLAQVDSEKLELEFEDNKLVINIGQIKKSSLDPDF